MLMMKFIGKPYAGKPHVRFDEGVGKVILPSPLYSTETLFDLMEMETCNYSYNQLFFFSRSSYYCRNIQILFNYEIIFSGEL